MAAALGSRHIALWLAATVAASSTLSAQIIGGQVVDATTRAPLVGLRVELLRHDTARVNLTTVDSTRTKANGFFQFAVMSAGVYQLDFRVVDKSVARGPVDTVAGDSLYQRQYLIPVTTRDGAPRTYFEFEVERPAVPGSDVVGPRYPVELRKTHTEGTVLAEFVVDTTGRVEMESFRVLRSTDVAFALAVKEALRQSRFLPAEIAGVHVRQRVHQPFQFQLRP